MVITGAYMKRTIAALVPLLMAGAMTVTSAQADTEQRQTVIVTGFLDTSCGSWTQARGNHQSAYMEYWVMGFVSGANVVRASEDKTDILKGTDPAALWSWIDNYCYAKPLERFPVAVGYLVIELRERAHQ